MIQPDISRETKKQKKVAIVSENGDFSFKGGEENSVDSLTGMHKARPVYRFSDRNTGVNFYTTCEIQRKVIKRLNNFDPEEIVFLAYQTEVDGSIPVYRFQDPYSGAYFDTLSIIDGNDLSGFQFRGIAYYALPI